MSAVSKRVSNKAGNKNVQAHTQTNSIVHPRYGCMIGAAYSVAAITRGVPIVHCGPGCIDKQYFILCSDNGNQGVGYMGGGAIPSTNIGENDVVFGGAPKLERLIDASLKIMDGDIYVAFSGCSSALVGDDVESITRPYQNSGLPLVYVDAPGFKGNNLIGHELVVNAIIDQFVGPYKGRKKKGLVNLWTEVPYFNTNWRGDLIELKRILEGVGFTVNVLFGIESGGVSEWKSIPKASFNILLSPWVGMDIVRHLEEKYGQPWVHFPSIPIGEESTSAFLREVVEFAGNDKEKAEKFIANEAKQYYYFLEHFADFFSEYWFGLPSRFAVVSDSAYNIAFSIFLADQLGLIPVKHIITDNPPDIYRDKIQELYKHLSEGISSEVEFIEDGYLVEQSLKAADFGSGAPLILGTSWERNIARELGAIFLEVSTPAMEEIVINRSYIGYRGALSLIERIYTPTVNVF
ncbi:MAG: hydrogenase [Clostridiales Family XIII bacterium]|jgi:nitrogenase molybdenum-iron protein beta chain|nr:hydrogenase [Clostridiales Family XIII bacterium]